VNLTKKGVNLKFSYYYYYSYYYFLLAKFLRTGDCFSSQLLIFSQKKNWKNLGEMCFSSENLTNFANVFENGSIMVSNTRG
jgi:hypothetical protein